jgi:predicted LPLAT superfamily acyltransferase
MRTLRYAVWLTLHLGRPASRALVAVVAFAFAFCCPAPRAASRAYLGRVLGRRARFADVLRHFNTFATTVLDRVYFLNNQSQHFDITIHGEDVVTGILAEGNGCLLLGAHHGSFEVLRLVGRSQPDLHVSLAMYEETGRKIGAALNAINPDLAPQLIGLGTPGAMIEMRDCLERGGFVGMLADRSVLSENSVRIDFLGAPASFPTGPARLAALLRPPVVLMMGLYRGGNRYDIHFELLAPHAERKVDPADTDLLVRRYAARLEHFCRVAPYNWFNFFDFWS